MANPDSKAFGGDHKEIEVVTSTPTDLTAEHARYLIARHGTIDLKPIPSASPSDPLNWPGWRKNVFLGIFAVHGFMAGFLAAGLVPASGALAKAYGTSLSATSYLVSAQILAYGVAAFFWVPVMNVIGRRPSLLISTLGATVCNIGGAYCKTYAQQMTTRVLCAIFISPPTALGSVIVTNLFFQHQRGSKTGIWKLFFTAGAPGGPFLMGFVAQHAPLQWVFFTFAIVTGSIFLAYLIFGPETDFHPEAVTSSLREDFGWVQSLKFRKPQPHSAGFREMLSAFSTFLVVRRIVPICVYAIVFAYANVAIIITMPEVMGVKFGLDAQGIGLQFIALLIGLFLGEIIGGWGSDRWMAFATRRRGGARVIEDRLWLAYPGLICVTTGLVVWGVTTQNAVPLKWVVTPDVGAAIASFGTQLITTVLVTYVIDVDPGRATQTGLILNFVRQTWAFIGPFYLPDMFASLNFGGAGGLMGGICGVCGIIPILIIQFTSLGSSRRDPDSLRQTAAV